MVLQKMSIVLFELTEDMEYEVKRRFKGKVWAKARKNNFIIQRYFTRINYLGWLVAQKRSFSLRASSQKLKFTV